MEQCFSNAAMGNRTAPSSIRLNFLDLFRGFFIFIMIDAHTFNVLFHPFASASPIYQYHRLLFNSAGPGFLFAAGISFGLAAFADWSGYRTWSGRLRRRLMRLLVIFILGYSLHLPYFSLRRTLSEGTIDQFHTLFGMDILQCIATSGFLLLALVWVLPNSQWFPRVCVFVTVVIAVTSPLVWTVSQQLPWWWGTQLSKHWGSVFPLFPYSGFQFAGASWGYLYASMRQKEMERSFLEKSRRFGLWLILGSLVAMFLPLPEIYSDFWNASPLFFFLRVGLLTLVLTGFRIAESRLLPSLTFLLLLGRESLLVYVAHLAILYGSPINPYTSLSKFLGNERTLPEVVFVFLLLTGAMTILSWLWLRLKKEDAWIVSSLRWSLAGLLILVFVAR